MKIIFVVSKKIQGTLKKINEKGFKNIYKNIIFLIYLISKWYNNIKFNIIINIKIKYKIF